MKFHIESLQLWMKNGQYRKISFLPNKVNIVTGQSHTGKTAILDIFDYCFFASKHQISESIINESVEWYGLCIHINDHIYLIARRAPKGTSPSADYYLSTEPLIQKQSPTPNIKEETLKKLLGAEFGIDQDVTMPFGGKAIKASSRISLRYFLLFNTISQDVITHSDQFFDKQNQERYREALHRIFDIAVGIDTVENTLKREKKSQLERQLSHEENLAARQAENHQSFNHQLIDIITKAKRFGLIPNNDAAISISELQEVVEKYDSTKIWPASTQYEEVSFEIYKTSRKILGIEKFLKEHIKRKDTLKATQDSLKPIDYIQSKFEETIKTSVFQEIVSNLSTELKKIKAATATRTPLDSNINEILKQLHRKREELLKLLKELPAEDETFESSKAKYIFIGETKARLELYGNIEAAPPKHDPNTIKELQEQIALLETSSIEMVRDLFIKALDDTIDGYIYQTKAALGNYGDYRSSFNYTEKKLHLRKPRTTWTENVGSSSNHMFLHLFLFLGIHELILRNDAGHVAPLLIIDQFSRPYWGDDDQRTDDKRKDIAESDVSKVKIALELLNSFIKTTNDIGKEFQIIVFEHIDPKYWNNLENIHLVEVFRDGNALIPIQPEILN